MWAGVARKPDVTSVAQFIEERKARCGVVDEQRPCPERERDLGGARRRRSRSLIPQDKRWGWFQRLRLMNGGSQQLP